jgi:hypothetical protein
VKREKEMKTMIAAVFSDGIIKPVLIPLFIISTGCRRLRNTASGLIPWMLRLGASKTGTESESLMNAENRN